MKRLVIRLFVLFGIISITGIIALQVYFFQVTFSTEQRKLNQKIQVALWDVVNKIYEFNKIKHVGLNPVYQYSPDYYVVNVNDFIDARILEHYLIKTFEQHNIKLNFEYAIYDCQTDDMVYGNHINMGQKQHNTSTVEMPKYDEFIYYFGIYFPKRKQSITGNIRIIYTLSGILILVTLFFGYALIVILKHRRLTEIQNTVVNNLTHEFKTPLSSILLSTDVLSTDDIINEPQRIKNYVQIIRSQSQNLLSQIERILGMGELENIHRLNLKEINVPEFLYSFKNDIDAKVKTKSGEFYLEIKTDKSICADRFHFTNLIYNLIDNSIKYSVEPPRILMSTTSDHNYLFLSIKDNGIGIDKKYHKKIYKKFFRIPTGNIHNVKGFGLGLHYVYSIVKNHHWKIKLESKINEGTTFIIRIPLKKGNCD
ncbi:MAG: hypothetical protein A2W99_06140 [Bacteroidetes bacterium GWF2_33_16]|nr:MAG: hypothetical protein A2X00_12755 [Bacteroidetes bacterium GWE2_32_14]OFY05262.1 MAG: hypothetical protein A2W99_06140 [Bacteroidetes bacterium GWF2_33_16]